MSTLMAAGVPEQARLVLATHNPGKLSELRSLIVQSVAQSGRMTHEQCAAQIDQWVISAASLGTPEPVEDGATFAANALIKAQALTEATGLPAVADDSGLCVDIMGGAPGIFSARWCGHHGDDAANLRLLLNQLGDVPDSQRTARFTCAAVLTAPGAEPVTVERSMQGRLLREPVGEGGFGYDPIFVPTSEDKCGGAGRTTSEMSAAEKNAISHRGQAMRALAEKLVAIVLPEAD